MKTNRLREKVSDLKKRISTLKDQLGVAQLKEYSLIKEKSLIEECLHSREGNRRNIKKLLLALFKSQRQCNPNYVRELVEFLEPNSPSINSLCHNKLTLNNLVDTYASKLRESRATKEKVLKFLASISKTSREASPAELCPKIGNGFCDNSILSAKGRISRKGIRRLVLSL